MTQAVVTAAALNFATTNRWEDCKRICPDPDVVLDCGANLGQGAANLREAYPHATIHSFEPVAAIFEKLRPVAHGLNIDAVRAAVSHRTGWCDIHLTESHESNSLLAYLATDNPLAKYHRVRGRERVRTWRLDDWCVARGIAHERVHVLKLDVQGAELMALAGATRILAGVKAIMLEVALVPYYADCPVLSDVDAFMLNRGFARRHIYASAMPEIWADATYVPRE